MPRREVPERQAPARGDVFWPGSIGARAAGLGVGRTVERPVQGVFANLGPPPGRLPRGGAIRAGPVLAWCLPLEAPAALGLSQSDGRQHEIEPAIRSAAAREPAAHQYRLR